MLVFFPNITLSTQSHRFPPTFSLCTLIAFSHNMWILHIVRINTNINQEYTELEGSQDTLPHAELRKKDMGGVCERQIWLLEMT